MFCTHCAKEVDIKKVPSLGSTGAKRVFVCPRCGHLIEDHIDEKQLRELSEAAHAEVHKASNDLNRGKSGFVIGLILLCISILFLLMSFKATAGGALVPNCLEFYVFCGLITLGTAVETYGIVFIVLGAKRKKLYRTLLKDIQNGTFVQ